MNLGLPGPGDRRGERRQRMLGRATRDPGKGHRHDGENDEGQQAGTEHRIDCGVAQQGHHHDHHDASRTAQYICWGMIAVASCLPALQVWYLLWGGVFIGLVRLSERQERVVMIMMVALLGYSTIDAVFRTGLLSFVILAVMAMAFPRITRRSTEHALPAFTPTVTRAWQAEVHRRSHHHSPHD